MADAGEPEPGREWPLPSSPRPIVLIGAGGIVNDAHLPACRNVVFPVEGIYDIDAARSRATAEEHDIPRVYTSMDEVASVDGAVFDMAVPSSAITGVLRHLPDGATVRTDPGIGAARGVTRYVDFSLPESIRIEGGEAPYRARFHSSRGQ